LRVGDTIRLLTDAERQALEWFRDRDPRAAAVAEELLAALVERYLLIRMTPPGGDLYAISPRGLRALRTRSGA
jgi:hypothetical protein